MRELYYRTRDHFLSQRFTVPFKTSLNEHSLLQLDNIITVFDKNYLRNLKKEMVVNLLKYNVDGDWVIRLNDSKNYVKDGFSLESCQHRYGDIIGNLIFNERIEKVKPKEKNYTSKRWKEICNSKKSNLGLDGYIVKFGKVEGSQRWNDYQQKWKLRIKENDYLKNNKETVERCIKFINENYERA